ncbi:hypothetical protein GCM10027174_34660 [Salinifilum aidingensis]
MDPSAAPAADPPVISVPRRSLVVFAGIPGAGKSTVLGRLSTRAGAAARATPGEPVVLDSDEARERLRSVLPGWVRYGWYRPLVHVLHGLRIVRWCLVASGPVAAHEPATRASSRALLALCARLSGRERVLVWLRVDPGDALDGQRARGRLIGAWSFARHVRRAVRIEGLLATGAGLRGWPRVHAFSRHQLDGGIRVDVSEQCSR